MTDRKPKIERADAAPGRVRVTADRAPPPDITIELDGREHWLTGAQDVHVLNDDETGGLRKRIGKLECGPVGLAGLGRGDLA